eukprot:TRINITY_DN5918_c0_g1_i1.p2 TRINITY_DN5918_c0_g1~~TRINITY_DN5918_c0_g1_i1.p2  ORF type:complete len:347 (+),score=63.75 TRINITY_DN5918_c0_g1_i1:69-1043(+)
MPRRQRSWSYGADFVASQVQVLMEELRHHVQEQSVSSVREAIEMVHDWAADMLRKECVRAAKDADTRSECSAPAAAAIARVAEEDDLQADFWSDVDQCDPYVIPHATRSPDVTRERSRSFLQTHQSRRSCRHFSKEEVPMEVLEDCIKAAGTAPSGANLQPWTYVVVQSPEVRRRLREVVERHEAEFYTSEGSRPFEANLLRDIHSLRIESSGPRWQRAYLEDAAHVVCVFKQVFRPSKTGDRGSVYFPDTSVSISVGTFLAACHHSGLATLVVYPSGAEHIRDVLGRPRREKLCLLVVVGRPAAGCRVPRMQRKAFEDIVAFI